MPRQRQFDVVLFGATGYTGRLTAEYLARHGGAGLRWALAGRRPARLAAVRKALMADATTPEPELLQADVSDAASLQRLAKSTRVVITTVGPYILHGEPLVAACAGAGTDYVDLTGEPEFVDRMWLRYQQRALKTGARLVHSCGFDSIPHDLGAWFTVKQLPEGVPLKVEGFVRAGGRFSAGTYHSAIHAFSRARAYAAVRRERTQREEGSLRRRIGSTGGRMRYERSLGSWVVPFPSIDPQVVKRSARALERYGPDFRYGHYIQVKKATSVAGLLGGVGAVFALAQLKPTRDWLLARKKSGEGPTPEQRAKAWFRVRFVGEGGGQRVVVEVKGGDPGYAETAKMLAESALCLAFDDLPGTAGQVTPVVAMGDALLARLQNAGITFEVVDVS
jgi:short subunit dehydrogenase-like uncharacterized protein